jgi:hypothetical protein
MVSKLFRVKGFWQINVTRRLTTKIFSLSRYILLHRKQGIVTIAIETDRELVAYFHNASPVHRSARHVSLFDLSRSDSFAAKLTGSYFSADIASRLRVML